MKLKLPIQNSPIKRFPAIFKVAMFFAFTLGMSTVQAQVSAYNVTQTLISPGPQVDALTAPVNLVPVTTTADDAIFPITFGGTPAMSFKFNGVAYTGMFVSTNGFVYFDTAPLATVPVNTVNPIASTIGYDGAIAPLAVDLLYINSGTTTSLRWSMEGTYPDRRIIVEWSARRKSPADTAPHKFQLHLYEDGTAATLERNTIVMQYNSFTAAPQYSTTNALAQVGLRGSNTSTAEVLALINNNLSAGGWPVAPATFAVSSVSTTNFNTGQRNNINASAHRQFTWRPTTCFVPTALSAVSITDSGATFNWTAPTPVPAGYEYEIRTSGAGGSGALGLVTSGTTGTNSVTVSSGLPADTPLFVYVRSSCGGPFSLWTAGVSFRTQCASVGLPYAQYFDPFEAPGFTVPNVPACTRVVQAGTGNVWVTEGPDFGADFFDEHLVYNSSGSSAADTWYFTKGLALTTGQTYRISYVYGGTFGLNIVNQMNVAFGAFAEPGAMVNFISDDTNIKTSPLEFVGNFTVPANGTYYFGFHAKSAQNMGKLYLDNIDIMVETCLAPTAIFTPGATITPTSAIVFFTPPASVPGDGYQYYLSQDPTPPAYGTTATGIIASGANSISLTGLAQLTTYYIWIRSNCGTKYSLWSPVSSFTTTGVPLPTPIPMVSLTPVTLSGCNVTFLDSGGASGNYTDGENRTYTFTAPPGFQLQVVFNSFATENNYDGLMIHDGPSTGSPIIPSGLPAGFNVNAPANSFYGNTSPGTFYSTNNAITFKFTSDGSVTTSGWSATLRCVQAPTITSFTPFDNNCLTGTVVTVNGSNFGPGAVVAFNGVPAVTTYVSTVQLTAILPANATTGLVSVTSGSPAATGTSANVAEPPFRKIFTVNKPGPVTTGISVCAGEPATGLLTTSTPCAGFIVQLPRNSISSAFTAGSPSANRQPIVTNSTVCQFSTILRQYEATEFQVSTTGVYTFNMVSGIDAMGYITQPPFNTPGVCMAGFVIGDDDSGPGLEPQMTVLLNAGITYTLYSTTWLATVPGTFTWNITPPAGGDILLDGNGVIEWWSASTGGTLLHTGDTYNPVGDAGSGITDMNTAITRTYYAACSTSPVCRTPTIYEIKPLPTVAMTGAGTAICAGVVVPITASGTATTYVWSSSVASSLFTDPAGTVDYNGTDSLLTIYLKSNATATVTLTGTDSATSCVRTVTGVYTVNTKTWNGVNAWIPAGAPTITDALVFNTGTYAENVDLNGCSCTVSGGAQVTIVSGRTMRITNELNVSPLPTSLTFEDDASLVQVNDLSVNVGPITYIRETTPMALFDYTYWSSPVYPQSLFGLSQYTLSDKFFIYNQISDNYQNVVSSTIMERAKGYLVRAPQPGVGPTPWTAGTPFIGEFKGSTGNNGIPNNGVIPVPLFNTGNGVGTNDRLNLIGNPYPSAVNIDLFLNANVGGINAGKLDGIVYLWTHNTQMTGNVYQYSDYAIYTYLGGVGTQAGGGSGNTNVPDGEIAAGQAFYVKAHPSTAVNTTLPTVTAIFNNSMRVSGNNEQFFRLSAQDKNRIWLELKNDQGAYKQTLVGYTAGATNNYDSHFDGEILEAGNIVSLYSIGNPEKFAIQGRAMPFDNGDLVPLGYRSTIAGNFQIALSNFDGLFASQDIFLEDKLLNVIHNLKNGSYVFATAIGTFEERFVLRYTDTTLGIDNPLYNDNAALVYKMNEALHVVSGNATMRQIKIFDVRGRLLAEKKNLSSSEVVFDNLSIAQEVLLVQITLNDGTIVSKKTVF